MLERDSVAVVLLLLGIAAVEWLAFSL